MNRTRLTASGQHPSYRGYIVAVLAVVVSTIIFLPGRETFAKGQWALLYLLVILLVASAAGTGPAVVAAVLAFFAWNFFFLPPYHTFSIQDPKDLLSLAAFLIVGVIVGVMAGRMRDREARATAGEHEAMALNRVSAELVSQTSTAAMAQAVAREAVEQLGAASATLFLADEGELKAYCSWPAHVVPLAKTAEEAGRVYADGRPPGLESGDAGPADLALPLQSSSTIFGVLSVSAATGGRALSPAEVRLATSLANLVSAFLERQELQAKATQAEAGREADRLKSSLLSSVSHELKTPLAALTATVSNLLESDVQWDEESVRAELGSIVSDITRLNSSIGALLDLSRLESRTWEPRREMYDLSDIVAAGVDALPVHQRGRVKLDIPDDLDPVLIDYSQWVRVVQNLLENAMLYSGAGTTVTVGARETHRALRVWVEDEGPGLAADEHEAVFDKFYRGRGAGAAAPSGTGLGLAITREIVRAHGGTVHVEDVVPRGARFVITLPTDGTREEPE
jgi:two-component system, OmpR family, sensor histidine kinase KdpD